METGGESRTNGIIRKHRRQSAILSQHKEIKEPHFDLYPATKTELFLFGFFLLFGAGIKSRLPVAFTSFFLLVGFF